MWDGEDGMWIDENRAVGYDQKAVAGGGSHTVAQDPMRPFNGSYTVATSSASVSGRKLRSKQVQMKRIRTFLSAIVDGGGDRQG